MIPFLEKFATDIYQKYSDQLSDICIVMPARRSKKYFSHYLNKIAKKTILLPELYSIDEFIGQISGLENMDQTELLLLLYQHHTKAFPEEGDDFKQFVGWASIFLKDINEIDMQLADAKAIFTSLTDIKSLSMYDVPENQRSMMQQNYIRFFEQLYHDYLFLNQTLLHEKRAYQGLIFKEAHRKILENHEHAPWSKIIFCGFNALTNSEIGIIKKLILEKKAEAYWDADQSFFVDKNRDAGYFLREAQKEFNLAENFPYLENNFAKIPKKIHIVGTPNNISQVKYAGELFEKLKHINSESSNDLVIVPADENLLPSLLNTIPPSDANITMGLPLSQTLFGKFYQLVLNMHLNRERMLKQSKRSANGFYHKDIIALLSHPIIQKTAEQFKDIDLSKAINHFKKQNIIYANTTHIGKLESINEEFVNYIAPLFTLESNPVLLVQLFSKFNHTIQNLLDQSKEKNLIDYFNRLSIDHFQVIFEFLENLLPKYQISQGIDFLINLYQSKISEYNTSFIGDAIHGPQIMGLLETRLLDFDTVIMLSVNEGMLPAGKSSNSLLPFDLRRHFKLHSHIQKDAVYAYHFFRILQRAKTIYLIYNSDLKDGKSEKSRFLRQLIYDIVPECPNIEISDTFLNIAPGTFVKKEIFIKKSELVLEQMKSIQRISPTALSTYILCPLRFYFKYVARIKEADEITENADDAILGTVIHEVLKKIYEQFPKKQKINLDQFEKVIKQDIDILIFEAFENIKDQKITRENLKVGKNRLAFEVIKNYLQDFLKKEAKLIKENELIPLGFEQKANIKIKLQSTIKENIELYGVIDRIDSLNEELRILDYKSGKVEQRELKFSEMSELFMEPKLAKSLQLMCYSLLFSEQSEEYQEIIKENGFIPGIISFKSQDVLNYCLYNGNNVIKANDIADFKNALSQFVSAIFNPEIGFLPTGDEVNCEYCPYKAICLKD